MLAGLSDVPNSSLCNMRRGYQKKRQREGDMHTTDHTRGADEAVSENGETRFPRKTLAPGQTAEKDRREKSKVKIRRGRVLAQRKW